MAAPSAQPFSLSGDDDVADPWAALDIEKTPQTLSFINDVQSAVAEIEHRLTPRPSTASSIARLCSASNPPGLSTAVEPENPPESPLELSIQDKIRQFELAPVEEAQPLSLGSPLFASCIPSNNAAVLPASSVTCQVTPPSIAAATKEDHCIISPQKPVQNASPSTAPAPLTVSPSRSVEPDPPKAPPPNPVALLVGRFETSDSSLPHSTVSLPKPLAVESVTRPSPVEKIHLPDAIVDEDKHQAQAVECPTSPQDLPSQSKSAVSRSGESLVHSLATLLDSPDGSTDPKSETNGFSSEDQFDCNVESPDPIDHSLSCLGDSIEPAKAETKSPAPQPVVLPSTTTIPEAQELESSTANPITESDGSVDNLVESIQLPTAFTRELKLDNSESPEDSGAPSMETSYGFEFLGNGKNDNVGIMGPADTPSAANVTEIPSAADLAEESNTTATEQPEETSITPSNAVEDIDHTSDIAGETTSSVEKGPSTSESDMKVETISDTAEIGNKSNGTSDALMEEANGIVSEVAEEPSAIMTGVAEKPKHLEDVIEERNGPEEEISEKLKDPEAEVPDEPSGTGSDLVNNQSAIATEIAEKPAIAKAEDVGAIASINSPIGDSNTSTADSSKEVPGATVTDALKADDETTPSTTEVTSEADTAVPAETVEETTVSNEPAVPLDSEKSSAAVEEQIIAAEEPVVVDDTSSFKPRNNAPRIAGNIDEKSGDGEVSETKMSALTTSSVSDALPSTLVSKKVVPSAEQASSSQIENNASSSKQPAQASVRNPREKAAVSTVARRIERSVRPATAVARRMDHNQARGPSVLHRLERGTKPAVVNTPASPVTPTAKSPVPTGRTRVTGPPTSSRTRLSLPREKTESHIPRVAGLAGSNTPDKARVTRTPRRSTFTLPRSKSALSTPSPVRRLPMTPVTPSPPKPERPSSDSGSVGPSSPVSGASKREPLRKTLSFSASGRSTTSSGSSGSSSTPTGTNRPVRNSTRPLSPLRPAVHRGERKEGQALPRPRHVDRNGTMSVGHENRQRPPRNPSRNSITVPRPFSLGGLGLHEKAQQQIEQRRRQADEQESRRPAFKARPMPDFSKPYPPPHQ